MPKEPISLDMTKAVTMEPIPDNTSVLCMLSDMDIRDSKSSDDKVAHVELSVTKPDTPGLLNRRLFDDINLDNEFTLGRLLNLLKGLGLSEEEIRKTNFALEPENLIGRSCAVTVGIRKSEEFGDRNTIKRVRPAESYAG